MYSVYIYISIQYYHVLPYTTFAGNTNGPRLPEHGAWGHDQKHLQLVVSVEILVAAWQR